MTVAKENTVAESVENATKYFIECEVTRIKGETKDGKKYDFLSYTAYDKKGRKSKLKFTKDAEGMPKEEGLFTLEISPKMINRDKQTRYNEYWVKGVISYKHYDGYAEDDEELPF